MSVCIHDMKMGTQGNIQQFSDQSKRIRRSGLNMETSTNALISKPIDGIYFRRKKLNATYTGAVKPSFFLSLRKEHGPFE